MNIYLRYSYKKNIINYIQNNLKILLKTIKYVKKELNGHKKNM